MSVDEDPTMEKRNEAFRETAADLVELAVHVGLLNSVMHNYPEHVREGFLERLGNTRGWIAQEIEELQQFGEAFDEED